MRLSRWAILSWALLAGAVACQGVQARPQATTKYVYYPISGDSAVDLYNAMIRRGPHVNGSKAYAATSAASSQQGVLEPGKSCRVKNYRFKIDFTIRLPKFSNESSLPPVTRARWQEFSAFLRKHEETHRSIWMQCGEELETKIAALKAKNCDAADKMAAALWDQMRASCSKRHEAFDAAEQKVLMKHPFVKLVLRSAVKTNHAIAVRKKKRNFASPG